MLVAVCLVVGALVGLIAGAVGMLWLLANQPPRFPW
jgi:hypothetical protein